MGGLREVEYSPTWLEQRATVSAAYSHVRYETGGAQRVSDQMARELRRLGKDPDTMTRVEAFAATRLVSEAQIGARRIGMQYSLPPIASTSTIDGLATWLVPDVKITTRRLGVPFALKVPAKTTALRL